MPENHTEEYVKKSVSEALSQFMTYDYPLLEAKANERSITHKLAEYLKQKFPTWNVDCEYNRDGIEPKRIHIDPISTDSYNDEGETAYPDIIVHERGKRNNLLVIEVKKDTNISNENIRKDKEKLKAYKRDLGYKFGLFLIFNTGRNYKKPSKLEWVPNATP